MKKIIILAAIVLVWQNGQSQANPELTGLIRQSFTYFPRIQELNKTAEIGEMRIEVAQTGYLPSVSGVASYSYLTPISEKEFAPGQNLQFNPYNNYNLNVGVNQLIWDFGKTSAQVEKAKADLLVANQNTASAKLLVASQVASIYYSLIYLKDAVVVQDSVLVFYERNEKIVEGKIRQGDALDVDLSAIKSTRDQEKIRKEEFLRQFQRQLALMRYTTGQATDPAGQDFDFTLPASDDFSSNPEVLAATERINSARADLKYANSNKLPSLNFNGGAGYKNGYQPDINAFRFNYIAGVSLAVPIFQGGKIRKNVTIAQKSMELSEISKAGVVNNLQRDLEGVQADLKAYKDQIANSEAQIDVAKQTFQLTKVRYQQGVLTYLDLINASTSLQRAHLNKLQYQYQQILAEIELYRILGVKFWQE